MIPLEETTKREESILRELEELHVREDNWVMDHLFYNKNKVTSVEWKGRNPTGVNGRLKKEVSCKKTFRRSKSQLKSDQREER